MASAESSEIQILESATEGSHPPFLSLNAASAAANGQNTNLPVRHRMHRSAVRPFFCCGSEISLVSLVDNGERETSIQRLEAEKCSEIADENNSSDSLLPKTKTTSPKCNDCVGGCVGCRRQTSSSRRKKNDKMQGNLNKSKKKFWNLKLRGKLPHAGRYSFHLTHAGESSQESTQSTSNVRRDSTREMDLMQSASNQILLDGATSNPTDTVSYNTPLKLIADFDHLYPTDDIDEKRMADRAKEIRDGIDIGGKGRSASPGQSQDSDFGASGAVSTPPHVLCQMFDSHCSLSSYPSLNRGYGGSSDYEESLYGELDFSSLSPSIPKGVHTQVDYMHCLVPDLTHITNCSFYWGEMDRYEAEKLLENKPEGTFLLRDSAQEDFLFSVSFRRYNRSLHARIEQWNHKFSFDAHDPAVFSTETVCGLIEHYKDPNCCMFFEPMLTMPLNRSFPFSLQRLCRSSISDRIVYNSIAYLPLPKALKEYITCYHYKQKVRVRQVDMPN